MAELGWACLAAVCAWHTELIAGGARRVVQQEPAPGRIPDTAGYFGYCHDLPVEYVRLLMLVKLMSV